MRFFRLQGAVLLFAVALALGFSLTSAFVRTAYSQETTGGLQGTVKDPTGALVPRAEVVVTGSALIGSKEVVTDASGYYRFSNLPPGNYTLTVKAPGFEALKRQGVILEVGHLPTVNLTLKVGSVNTVVEVNTQGPVIDTTTTQNIVNVNTDALQNLPTGTTYQSVIQFAPMARNEPLAGQHSAGEGSGGTGGSLPGSSGNGLSFGYSIGGASDSESSYLVEGQDTENISGGYSKANVPMDFIQEVEMKTSGISAEYGGALGGVVNVVMKKGGNDFHGSIFSTYESNGLDGNPVSAFLRYDPTDSGNGALRLDPAYQLYQPKKDHFRTVEPGVTVGGPILKDKLVFFAGFEPLVNSRAKTVDFGANDNNAGKQYFTQDRQTYFGTARLDATLSQKIRIFGSWLYQYARETGDSLPIADPTKPESTYLNTSTLAPLTAYSHGLGWSAPNSTYNTGADISLTQHLVSTTRFGYFFENYHDFGWPTSSPDLQWVTNGAGANGNDGNPLPTNLALNQGTTTTPYLSSYTLYNADKHYQFNQDLAFYKASRFGTHNLKVGYQLNHLINVIDQNGNVPFVLVAPGAKHSYSALTTTGAANCALLKAEWGYCAGQYGYLTVQDFATVLTKPASDWNHAFYVQDSWTLGKGLTLDLGLRIEKETLPAPGGLKVSSIAFDWSDKIEPRLGAAWDPSGKGKMKLFGSYGVVNDVMKLLLAQTSWGAQAYELCTYPLGPNGAASGFNISDIDVAFKGGRACPSAAANVGANFANGQTPPGLIDAKSGVSLVENVNLRPWEPVAPGVKPYRQHEFVVGFDYQIKQGLDLEARYDRRRLDHVIEDASLSDPDWGETYTIVNPGEGVNKTLNGYANYLTSIGEAFGVPGWAFNADPGNPFGTCAGCPPNPKAIRNYDGLEFRLTFMPNRKLYGMISYTYSSLWGNYTGLTTTDQSDGGNTGRNSPDTTRSFDEPFYYFGANGRSNNGALPTDRPNVLKGNAYYTATWPHNQTTTFGLVQQFLQGSPVASYIDLGAGEYNGGPFESTYVFGRDKWVDMTTDANGNITLGTPYARRTPWFIQTDLNASHQVKVGDHQTLTIEATALNALNQHSVAAYLESMDSWNFPAGLLPGGVSIYNGAATYAALEGVYDVASLLNANGVVKNSQYGKPSIFQGARSLRLGVHFNF
ncbi:MAG: TonB-dependent receptor [Terracidiphilus sp.]